MNETSSCRSFYEGNSLGDLEPPFFPAGTVNGSQAIGPRSHHDAGHGVVPGVTPDEVAWLVTVLAGHIKAIEHGIFYVLFSKNPLGMEGFGGSQPGK